MYKILRSYICQKRRRNKERKSEKEIWLRICWRWLVAEEIRAAFCTNSAFWSCFAELRAVFAVNDPPFFPFPSFHARVVFRSSAADTSRFFAGGDSCQRYRTLETQRESIMHELVAMKTAMAVEKEREGKRNRARNKEKTGVNLFHILSPKLTPSCVSR